MKLNCIVTCLAMAVCLGCASSDLKPGTWKAVLDDGQTFRGRVSQYEPWLKESWLAPFQGGRSGHVVVCAPLYGEPARGDLVVVNGRPSRQTVWTADGVKYSESAYITTNTETRTLDTFFYPTGGKKAEIQNCRWEEQNGLNVAVDGDYKCWYSNGMPETEFHIVSGKRDGHVKWWDLGGQLVAEGVYSNGTQWHGTFVWGSTNNRAIIKHFDEGKCIDD